MKDIKMYTTSTCPYCKAAKRILKDRELAFEEINIEEKRWDRKKLLEVGIAMTVPQIVIDGNPIGGYEDLIRLLS